MVNDELRVHLGDQVEFAFAQFGNVRDDEVCVGLFQLGKMDGRTMKQTWPQLTSFAHDNSDMLRAFLHFASQIKRSS